MHSLDPLIGVEPAQQELFQRFSRVADGFSTHDAVGAAFNLLVNALRQAHPSRDKALASFDNYVTKVREKLAANYMNNGKRLEGVFPFPQTIEIPFLDLRDKKK